MLIGDSASAHGGFVNAFLPSLPDWLVPTAKWLMGVMNVDGLMGATTPDGPYPTDVFTLPGDGWADWPQDVSTDLSGALRAAFGAIFVHAQYYGLTPEDVSNALANPPEYSDGTADYYSVSTGGVSTLATLWDSAWNFLPIATWLAEL